MNPERWQLIESLFLAASERDASRRIAFLDEVCRGDAELRREVDALIAADDQAEKFIEAPALIFAADLIGQHNIEPEEGRKLGPYQLVRELGEGGMGAVYLAIRADDHYRKQVAVKLVKRGLDTDETRRRFRHERQILANLDHPNIARLIDGGTTEHGRPYLVMDYVEGVPITRYCDEHQLSTEERLKLFQLVCLAVGYAHRNLVIHRDIKPSNIIVTEEGTPKLLDFGIAKLLSSAVAQSSERTATVARIMTPQYASPEQVRGSAITTASDIYSLGVLLYKLLTGHHPYQFKTLLPAEIEKVICEKEPERPSTAITRVEESTDADGVTTSKITPESVSEARSEQPDGLRRKLKGDLDSIVLMAMRKERERRYSSVEQFSEDIRRHLEGLPVVATTDTFKYRASKFVGRNKVGVAAATLIALALVVGIIATAWQARAARRERDKTSIEKANSERINAFLQNTLSYADPSWYSPGHEKGPNVTLIDVLNEAADRIDKELGDQPEARAELHHTIGNTYRARGLYDAAEKHFRSALELYREIYGEEHPKVAQGLYYLGATIQLKGDKPSAVSLFRQALAMMRALDEKNVNLPYILSDLGGLLVQMGDDTAGEPLLTEALGLIRERYGEDHVMVIVIYSRLGDMYEDRGDLDRAQAMYQEAMRIQERAPNLRSQILELGIDALENLSRIDREKGEYGDAEALLIKALDFERKSVGDLRPRVADALFDLAGLHRLTHNYVKAEEEAKWALEILRRNLAEHLVIARTLTLLSEILIEGGKRNEAESYLREALRSYRNAIAAGKSDPSIASGLGETLTLLRHCAEAEPLLTERYASLKSSLGDRNPKTIEALERLVELYQAWKRPDQAARFRALLTRP